MEEKPETGRPSRIVEISRPAAHDLEAIYNYTAEHWSEAQAEEYVQFLRIVMARLADNTSVASTVPEMAGLKVYIARWDNAHHGHRIFFQETGRKLQILRILHTAMNWQDHLT